MQAGYCSFFCDLENLHIYVRQKHVFSKMSVLQNEEQFIAIWQKCQVALIHSTRSNDTEVEKASCAHAHVFSAGELEPISAKARYHVWDITTAPNLTNIGIRVGQMIKMAMYHIIGDTLLIHLHQISIHFSTAFGLHEGIHMWGEARRGKTRLFIQHLSVLYRNTSKSIV